MEGIIQTLVDMGPLKIIGGIVFVLSVIAVIKAACSKNNMPGGGSGSSSGSGSGSTGGTTPTNTQPPQNQQ